MASKSHARLSPSTAARWTRCPGSVNLIADVDDDFDSEAANEGTILHSLMEKCLREGIEPYEFVGKTKKYRNTTLKITDEIADMLVGGLDEIDAIRGKLFIEKRVSLDCWLPGQFGTCDVGIVGKREIIVWDHKFGGNPVSPIRNEQAQCYALGFWDNIARHKSDATDFRVIIWQPRAPGGGGEWRVTLDELLEFAKELKEKAAATRPKDAPRIPGVKQCTYCPGAKQGICPEYDVFNTQMLFDDLDALDDDIQHGIPPRLPIKGVTPERRGYILEHRPLITKFLDRLHADALDDALKGRPTPGQKAVLGRSPARSWLNVGNAEKRIVKVLGDDAYEKKFKSPTQVEKEVPKKIYQGLSQLVNKGEKKPTLVSIDDPREAIEPMMNLFDDD